MQFTFKLIALFLISCSPNRVAAGNTLSSAAQKRVNEIDWKLDQLEAKMGPKGAQLHGAHLRDEKQQILLDEAAKAAAEATADAVEPTGSPDAENRWPLKRANFLARMPFIGEPANIVRQSIGNLKWRLGLGNFRAQREKRLAQFGESILYHVTSSYAADAILSSGKMLPGKVGKLGGGIYFAKTSGAALKKALTTRPHKGGWVATSVVLKCRVRLGKMANVGLCPLEDEHDDPLLKSLEDLDGPADANLKRLNAQGYDSVRLKIHDLRNNQFLPTLWLGDEYVVYDSEQVVSCEEKPMWDMGFRFGRRW